MHATNCTSLVVLGSLLGVATALLTAILIVLLRPVLVRYALARPNARSSHKVPTPQGGGIAIVAATTLGIALVLLICPASPWRSVITVLAASLVLAVVGAADDIVVLRALPRLILQIAAAIVVVMVLPDGARVIPIVPTWVEHFVLVLALVWFVNLVNFMDGIDWITVVEVLPICAGIATIAALGEAPAISFVVAVALGGATLGFAPFNRPVAKLFLGDVGSLPVGLLVGWQLVVIAKSGHLIAAILLPLYYLADATITLARRVQKRERVWEAHRTHYYQRATDRGFTVTDVVLRIFVGNIVLLALAVSSVVTSSWIVELAMLACGAICVGLLLRMLQVGRDD